MPLTIVIMITLTFSRHKSQYFEMKTNSQVMLANIIPTGVFEVSVTWFLNEKETQKNRNSESIFSVLAMFL